MIRTRIVANRAVKLSGVDIYIGHALRISEGQLLPKFFSKVVNRGARFYPVSHLKVCQV